MTTRQDPALGFLADFVAAEGGLHEERSGLLTCLVPDELRRVLDVGEELTVTADPDAAREDGAVLLAPGHPLVDTAADRVLEVGDAGVCHLASPPGLPPSIEALLPRLRDNLTVDHGRVDAAGDGPTFVRQPVLTAGALVTFDVTSDDRFHERVDVSVDATTGQPVPAALRAALDGPPLDGPLPHEWRRIAQWAPAAAVAAVHRLLEERAADRLAQLSAQRGVGVSRREEVERAAAYYSDLLASLANRRATAPPDRARLLDGQAEAVRAERSRRLQEIDEKFDGRFQIRPFRLHLLTVPALALPLVVRRGARVFPLTVTWLLGPARPLAPPCPRCGLSGPLVAAKDGLGCRRCVPGASLAPVAAPRLALGPTAIARPVTPAPSSPAPAAEPRPHAPPGRAPAPPTPTPVPASRPGPRPAPGRGRDDGGARTRAGHSALDVGRHGDKLARHLWKSVFAGRRWPRQQVAAGSPLDALFRLYGQRALGLVTDIPPGLPLTGVRASTCPSRRGRAEVTTGTLTALGARLPFTVRWRWSGGQAVPGEVLPFVDERGHAARALPVWVHLHALAEPRTWADPVAAEIWALVERGGFPIVARALAAWWEAQKAGALAEVDPGSAARLVVEAVRSWPAANPVTKLLGGPDWWV